LIYMTTMGVTDSGLNTSSTKSYNGSNYTIRVSEAPQYGSLSGAFSTFGSMRTYASKYNASGTYLGSTTTTTNTGAVHAGIWTQIELPTSVSINKYTMGTGYDGTNFTDAPFEWVVLGSDTASNSSWDLVHYVTLSNFNVTQFNTFYTSNISPYRYFRTVYKKTGGTQMQTTLSLKNLSFTSCNV
jgi:hypothetical protein